MFSSSKLTLSLFLYLSFFALFSPSSASRSTPSESQKVSLALYYESLCPYSANFIVNYLTNLFKSDLISIVDLKLVPWGNARLKGNNTFTCQHGPYECLLNTVEACAINIWPDLDEHFPFINCIETLVYDRKYLEWKSCFQKLDLNPKPILDCSEGGYGKELDLQYAAETNSLQPPHKYVPWVVVDGKPLYEDYENFISYICEAYQGTPIPKRCTQAFLDLAKIGKEKAKRSVCYKEGMISSLSEKVRLIIASWMKHVNLADGV
ncbi:hypothetical protein L6164_026107 [Bauhinia variegata]|uniref:Uncharacterized protein n=1 Tax=Bauhinia variegata TaxID=167791 RepID=A0ACB9M6K9_BAUVA|nr:hypothetical protein L6164_026107 [Bauhinia variegata]